MELTDEYYYTEISNELIIRHKFKVKDELEPDEQSLVTPFRVKEVTIYDDMPVYVFGERNAPSEWLLVAEVDRNWHIVTKPTEVKRRVVCGKDCVYSLTTVSDRDTGDLGSPYDLVWYSDGSIELEKTRG